MDNRFSRTAMLIGTDGVDKLSSCHVAVFGVGGVGGYVVEGLARSGIGAFDLIDNDVVALSNVNRQIIATTQTIGRNKVDVAAERILEINPACQVKVYKTFFTPDNADSFDFSIYDYVVDAIDTVAGKIAIIECAKKANIPVISAMGAGNKLDPTQFEVADISKTSVCPLARVMRRELHKRGIDHLKVVYSKEEPTIPADTPTEAGRHIPGSISYSPAIAGLVLASEVIKDLIK